jgi:hypothetical protein
MSQYVSCYTRCVSSESAVTSHGVNGIAPFAAPCQGRSGGFQILEVRERRVLLSQAAVRAISSYKDFAMGALRATEEDADAASRALQACVQPTFRDLQMKYLPRKWLEIIAVKP